VPKVAVLPIRLAGLVAHRQLTVGAYRRTETRLLLKGLYHDAHRIPFAQPVVGMKPIKARAANIRPKSRGPGCSPTVALAPSH
jgi:hypothetical protein